MSSESDSNNTLETDDDSSPDGLNTIESMCMVCGGNGVTRMLIHKIPFFRELIIASFTCNDCDEFNNEVTFGGEIQLQGCIFTLTVSNSLDLDRQIVKSDYASIRIPEIDFEIPPKTQKGEISTIEGFLKTAARNLSLYQEVRMRMQPEVGAKVAEVISKLEDMASGSYFPYNIIVNDPSGNSFIENPNAPLKDKNMTVKFYFRAPQQDEELGLAPNKGVYKDDKESNFKGLMTGTFGAGAVSVAIDNSSSNGDNSLSSCCNTAVVIETDTTVQLGKSEVVSIPSHCPNCGYRGELLTCLTEIPHFKEVIIMSFDCSFCGYRNNEVKGGGAIPSYGTEVILTVNNMDDLKRDVLKSDSCATAIPELELEITYGSMGGMYTTVEGLLNKIYKTLKEQHSYQAGDSKVLHHSTATDVNESKEKFEQFLNKIQSFSKGEHFPFTVKLRDPLGNSFISAPLGTFLTPEEDSNLEVVDFTRTEDENDEFGLTDMKTENYGEADNDSNNNSSSNTNDNSNNHTARSNGSTARSSTSINATVLPDRLTQKFTKGPDHPSYFAKGCEDATPGGAFIDRSIAVSKAATGTDNVSSESTNCNEINNGTDATKDTVPVSTLTWRAAKLQEDGTLEEFDNGDDNNISNDE